MRHAVFCADISTTNEQVERKGIQVNCSVLCALGGEAEADKEGSNRSTVADREFCVYTSSNINRRCRLDKEIKGKGATQIKLD